MFPFFPESDCPAGVGDRRLDLAAVAHDAFILQQPFDVARAEARDAFRLEVGERRAKVLPLPEDRQPGQPGLKAFEAEPFEQSPFVGDGPAPFLIVVRVVQRVARRPATRRLRQA